MNEAGHHDKSSPQQNLRAKQVATQLQQEQHNAVESQMYSQQ